MNSNFYILFNSFTLINLFILFIILFFRKSNSITNKVLALIVMTPGLNFLCNLLILSGIIAKVPFLMFLFQATSLIYSPLVYAYVLLITGHKFKLTTIPNIVSIIAIFLEFYFCFTFYFLKTPSEQATFMYGLTSQEYPVEISIMNGFFSLQGLYYLIISFLHIKKHTQSVRNFYSDLEKIKLHYIQIFIVLHIVLNLSMTFCYIVLPTQVVEYFCIPFFIDILYVFIVYYAFNHSAILTDSDYCNLVQNIEPLLEYNVFADPLCSELKEIKENNGQSKYKLTNIEIEANYKKMLDCFQNQKPHLDPSINLTKLSNMLNACSHNISIAINSKFEMNFFDLINSYRVEEAKSLLKEIGNNKLSIEGCGYKAGFNSKMAFYRAFKKFVKMTPSEYIGQIKK